MQVSVWLGGPDNIYVASALAGYCVDLLEQSVSGAAITEACDRPGSQLRVISKNGEP